MADDKETKVKITGDSSGAETAMKKASDAVTKGVDSMQSSLGGVTKSIDKVTSTFKAFTAVLVGATFAALKNMVDQFAETVNEAQDLSRALSVTTNEVAGLQATIADVNSSTGEYTLAMRGLQRELTKNEEGLQKLGLRTRETNGELRPMNELMLDAIEVTNTFREGTDRSIAAQEFFGRGVEGTSRLLLINREALAANEEAARTLGLEVGLNATTAWKEFDSANDLATLGMQGFGRAVGETVMPAVTSLLDMFNDAAPAAIKVVRGALSGLTTAFLGLVNGVRLVWEVVYAMFISISEPIIALGLAVTRMLSGDFEGAADAIRAAPANIATAWETAFANVLKSSTDTNDRMSRMWDSTLGNNGGAGDNQASKGRRSAIMPDELKPQKATKDKKEHLDSRMAEWQAELDELKIKYQKENDLREMSKEQELAYWREISLMADVNAREKVELRKRTAQTELEIMKAQRTEQLALSEEAISAYKAQQLDVVEATRLEGQQKLDMQRITQMEMLQLEEQLEDDRYRITVEAVRSRMAVLATDPTKNVVALQKLNDELAAVEREHAQKQKSILGQQQKEQLKDWRTMFDAIGSGFGNVVTGLVNQTMTIGQAMKSLLSSTLTAVGNFIGQMIAKKVAAFAMEKALAMGLISVDAAKAGAGAAASQAGIPIVGPALALGSMATIMAAVLGLGATVASASGGYDIPAGVNPMTQLHEREMVLPAQQADAVRAMAEGGGGMGGGVTIQALDARSFERWLKGSGGDVMLKYLGSRKRDNAYTP